MRLLLLCALLLELAGPPLALSQGPGPVTADPVELDAVNLVEQFTYIPEFTVETDTSPVTEDDVRDLEEDEEYIYISSGLIHAPEPRNLGGNGSLTLIRHDNGERITARYRRADGTYDEGELRVLDHAMRCSLTGRRVRMSVKLIELLDAIEDKLGKRGLVLLSGYRTPKNNHGTPGAARESLHMLGWAADIRVPGYSSTRVKTYARRMKSGGVGYYPRLGFTHVDVGSGRYWVMRRPPRRRAFPRRPRARPASGRAAPARKAAPGKAGTKTRPPGNGRS